MSKVFIPYCGRLQLLQGLKNAISGLSWLTDLNIHLFKSNITPDIDDEIADYTAIEANFSGYTDGVLDTWTIPALDMSNEAFITHVNPLLWQHNGGATSNTIYGHYVTNNSNTELLWIEKYDTSKLMDDVADIITVIPRLTLAHLGGNVFIPYNSRVYLLNGIKASITGATWLSNVYYRLFATDITPALSHVLSNYSPSECNFDGYGVKVLSTWTIPAKDEAVGTAENECFIMHNPPQMWQYEGADPGTGSVINEVYGGYVTNSANDELIWVEKFDSPVPMNTLDDILVVKPRLILAHEE